MDPFTIAMCIVFGGNPCAGLASGLVGCCCCILIIFAGVLAWQVLKPVRDEAILIVDECIKDQVENQTREFQDEAFSKQPCLTLQNATCKADPSTTMCAQAGGHCVCLLAEHINSIQSQIQQSINQCCTEFDEALKFGGFFQKADDMCHLKANQVMSRMQWVHRNCTEGRAPYWHDDLFWSADLELTMPVQLIGGYGVQLGLPTLPPMPELPPLPMMAPLSFTAQRLFDAPARLSLPWNSSGKQPVQSLVVTEMAMLVVLIAVTFTLVKRRQRPAQPHRSLPESVSAVEEAQGLLCTSF
mmetsp:Transcript_98781/g.195847  ORF Transcript_98781/g.195847 Transcript_98781/m.195847 type:complete len:299 (-) Transcript_98781:130-1026(-)